MFTDGRLIDVILALVAAEAVAVVAWRLSRGGGPALPAFFANLLAGAFLLLGVREALGGADPWRLAAVLAAAFASHLADLSLRWRAGANASNRDRLGGE